MDFNKTDRVYGESNKLDPIPVKPKASLNINNSLG